MGAFRKTRVGGIIRMALAATLFVSTTASAQNDSGAVGCDPNLKPAVETEEQANIRNACEAHIGCRMVFSVMRTTCRTAKFLRDLADKVTPGKPIDNNVVAEAATPDLPPSAAADSAVSTARNAARPSPTLTTARETMQMPNGRTAYAETQTGANYNQSKGVLIYSNGEIARGDISNRRSNEGQTVGRQVTENGEIITPDGQMQAGRYFAGGRFVGMGDSSQLFGKGVTTYREVDGRTSILEGTFFGYAPDGEMVRRYSDGTARREIWQRGTRLAVGDVSTPGGVPPRVGSYSVPVPVWGPAMLEGSYVDYDSTGRERIILWCNRQAIAVGEFAPSGQAVHPQPRECPSPGTYRNGEVRVTGPDLRLRDEFWCRGNMTAATPWRRQNEAQKIWLPQNLRCEEPRLVEEEDDDGIVQTDAVQHTLQVPKPRLSSGLRADRVSGPPWPCNAEYGRTRAANYQSQEQFWPQFGFSLQRAIANWAPANTIFNSYNNYMATHPGFRSEPLWYGFAQGFLSDRQYLLAFSAELDAIAHSGQYDAGTSGNVGFAACLARYKAG